MAAQLLTALLVLAGPLAGVALAAFLRSRQRRREAAFRGWASEQSDSREFVRRYVEEATDE